MHASACICAVFRFGGSVFSYFCEGANIFSRRFYARSHENKMFRGGGATIFSYLLCALTKMVYFIGYIHFHNGFMLPLNDIFCGGARIFLWQL